MEERGKERKLGEASKITVHSQEGLVRLSESEPNWAVRGVLCSPEMDLPANVTYRFSACIYSVPISKRTCLSEQEITT